MVPLKKQNFPLTHLQRSPALNRLDFSPSNLLPRSAKLHLCTASSPLESRALSRQSPAFPKATGERIQARQGGRRSSRGRGNSRGSRALPPMGRAVPLFQDFLLKAVRAKREWPIQVPDAESLFGISFLMSKKQVLLLCATQLQRFQSQAVPLRLFSQTSTVTEA